jgi:hypothetical protein
MLLCRCDGLSPDHQMNLFTVGLGEPMTSDVEMQRPQDLQAAMSLARAFERRASAATVTMASALAKVPYHPRPAASATGSTVTSTPAMTPAAPTNPCKPRFRRLSPDEMVEKKEMRRMLFLSEIFLSGSQVCHERGFLDRVRGSG